MTESTQTKYSQSGCGPAVIGLVSVFSLMVGIAVGGGALFAVLTLSDDGLERLGLVDSSSPETTSYALAHPLVETLELQEGLDDDAIEARMYEDRQLFERCYRQVLDDAPETTGEIVFQFSVHGTSGDVVAAVARQNRTDNQALADCVTDALQSDWEFASPQLDGVATVRFHTLFLPLAITAD